MEMLPRGDMHRLLKEASGSKLSIMNVCAVLHQGLEALAYLHENRVTHRDLKLANIMVNKTISLDHAAFTQTSSLGIISAT